MLIAMPLSALTGDALVVARPGSGPNNDQFPSKAAESTSGIAGAPPHPTNKVNDSEARTHKADCKTFGMVSPVKIYMLRAGQMLQPERPVEYNATNEPGYDLKVL
jgi:hypothetical protein